VLLTIHISGFFSLNPENQAVYYQSPARTELYYFACDINDSYDMLAERAAQRDSRLVELERIQRKLSACLLVRSLGKVIS